MAIIKVCGVETEYGIQMLGVPDPNPITASSLLVNAYLSLTSKKVGWDFEDESPMVDARGFTRDFQLAPEVETHLVNTVLSNGARYYVDHAHPEYSSPECFTPREALLYDKAGEEVLRKSMEAAAHVLGPESSVVVYKNNSDRKGNSYGCHENYMMDRAVPFAKIVAQVMPFFVTRQIFAGAGKVGTEMAYLPKEQVPFQLSQRADFFEEEVGLETTLKRPIVNTRDEPHADASRFRRLHVILGDANMSEYSTFLKVGTTAIVLSMIEDGFLDNSEIALESPVSSLRAVSYDLSMRQALPMKDGRTITALEIQSIYLEAAKEYAASGGLASLGDEAEGKEILKLWEEVLSDLEVDPMRLAEKLDWVAKYRMISAYRERHGLAWDDSRLAAIDLQFHDIRKSKSLFYRLGQERLVSDEEIALAVTEPPRRTRAYFRGKCLAKYASNVAAANWDSMIFDLGEDPLRRVPMMDPLRGTADHVDELIRSCNTAEELVRALGT